MTWFIIGLIIIWGVIVGGTIKFVIPYIRATKKYDSPDFRGENPPPFWCDDNDIIYGK